MTRRLFKLSNVSGPKGGFQQKITMSGVCPPGAVSTGGGGGEIGIFQAWCKTVFPDGDSTTKVFIALNAAATDTVSWAVSWDGDPLGSDIVGAADGLICVVSSRGANGTVTLTVNSVVIGSLPMSHDCP